ncbi:hypothetical protein JHK82_034911 [Glycine max]|nr:hypothetical protein JHK87_034905 [Glycine soja]KAG4969199.1 hypothetical protein JHK85_035620 [Glycine max]KAG5111642.1 hypothetical protein JHK82_034911 [Glycine max]KAG5128967.1 hypothetical protein JHK84_035364 [Glycine max]
MELDGEVHQESNQWEQENEYFSQEQIESLPDVKEVIDIIIMEDVMEELFQVSMVVYARTSFVFLILCLKCRILHIPIFTSFSSRLKSAGNRSLDTHIVLNTAGNPSAEPTEPPTLLFEVWLEEYPTYIVGKVGVC